MDLAGASGPGGINSIRSHMWTHTNARLLVRTQATLRAVQSECAEDNDSKHTHTPPRQHTHRQNQTDWWKNVCPAHTNSHTQGSMLEQMCANFRAATKRRNHQLYLQWPCVCLCHRDACRYTEAHRAEVPETFVLKSVNSCESMTTRWLFPEDGPDSGGGGEQMWQGGINNNNAHTITDGCIIADSVLELSRNKIWLRADKNIFTRRHLLSFQ